MAFSRPLFVRTGHALYGERWQAALAADLEISDRTLRRWISGDATIPDGVAVDLLRLVTERAGELDDLAELLKSA